MKTRKETRDPEAENAKLASELETARYALAELRAWVIQHPKASLWSEMERDMLTRANAALAAVPEVET